MLLQSDLSDMALEIKGISINKSGRRSLERSPLEGLGRSFGGLNLNEGSSLMSLTTNTPETSQDQLQDEDSSYILATDRHMADNVDQWMLGVTSAEAAVQSSSNERRAPIGQRSAMVATSSFNMAQVWCLLALLLPLFNGNANRAWRCTPSMLFNSAEYFLLQFTSLASRGRMYFARLARQQVARDCFATAMDLILVVYAFGFLVLSMYQASIIG